MAPGSLVRSNIRYVVPYGPNDASVRERVHSWQKYLHADNVGASIGIGRAAARDSGNTTTLLLRHSNRFAQGLAEQTLLRKANFSIYELDDGLPVDNGRLLEHRAWWKPLFAKSRIAQRCAASADRCVVGNENLADWAGGLSKDVRIIPTCVEVDEYEQKSSYDIDGTPRILWIGSAATEPHLLSIAGALTELHRRHRATVVLVGDPRRPVPKQLQPFTQKIDWTPTIHHRISELGDVGIMPLPDAPYERYKCAYKLLQYGAAAMPMVGSPVGMSADVLRRVGADAPTTVANWIESMSALLTASSSVRERLGLVGRAVVSEEYSFTANWSKYRSALLD